MKMAEDSSVWPGGQKLNPDGCVVSVFKCVSHVWDIVGHSEWSLWETCLQI